MAADVPAGTATKSTGLVLLTLAAGQFLMTLDSSVMNVSIATVAKDVGTTVTGIQTAITLYTLVMAMFMITGGKIGSIIGRKRAFAIGCVIYGVGSLTTALAPNLTVLIIGWSFLEGIGAALILPAIVALVAGNFPPPGRPRAYGLVMAAGAIAVAVGPLIGGFATTYFSWRWVFVGEVVIVLGILVLARRVQDAPPERRPKLDLVGTVLSATGLGLAVYGVLRSSEWGWIQPKPDGPELLGVSPTVWCILGGLFVVWLFLEWERRLEKRGAEPLVRPELLANRQLAGGLVLFFYQYLIQAGLFFTIPLYLSVALGLSAIDTGIRILPLSITLLLAAAGIPRFLPNVSPRRVVRLGLLAMLAGIVSLFASIDPAAGAEIVTVPLLFAGLGIGALASQLGSVTVSAVPDEDSPEVGWVAEHRDQPGRLDRHGPGRLDADRRADQLVPDRDPAEPSGPRLGQGPGQRRARRRRALHLRRRSPGGARPGRRERGDRHRDPGGQPAGETGRAPRRPGRARRGRAAGAVRRPAHPHRATGFGPG